MFKCQCKDCICLCEEDGEWTCDELDKPIKDIKRCPEQSEAQEHTVTIEEHLVRTVKVWCKEDELPDIIEQAYRDEEIVLDADDFTGETLVSFDDSEFTSL